MANLDYKVVKTNLTNNGKKFTMLKYKPAKYSRTDIKEKLQELGRQWKEEGKEGTMYVNLLYPEGWRGGYATEFGDPIELFSYADSDDDRPDPDYYPQFEVVILPVARGAQGGNSNYNDCMYDCLIQLIKHFQKKFDTPSLFKQYLKLRREEKVPLEKLEIIEKLFPSYNIHVIGDHIYESKNNGKFDIYLRLKDEHFTLDVCNMWKVRRVTEEEKKPLVWDFCDNPERRRIFTPEKRGTVKAEFISKIRKYPHYDPETREPQQYVLVQCYKNKTLKETYEEFITKADLLKEITDGKINLYKTGSMARSALKLFHDLNPTVQPDKIEGEELEFIKNSSTGALIWGDEYKGEAHYYDVVSMYPTIQRDMSFGVPIKKGTLSKITQKELQEKKYFEYGIYRCKITGYNKHLFRPNKKNYYTHFDLTTAKEFGYQIEMIEDNKNNVLLYPGNARIDGRTVFSKYVDLFFKFKKLGQSIAKDPLNVLWGALCQTNIITISYDLERNEECEISEGEILRIFRSSHNSLDIDFVKNNAYFETDFARIKPFLLSRARRMIGKIIEPHLPHIKRVHTDGFYSDVPLEFKKTKKSLDSVSIGKDLGDLSHKYTDDCVVHHANKVTDSNGKKLKWEDLN